MAYSISLGSSPRLATVRFEGRLSTRDLQAACHELLELKEWSPGTPQLWDFSKVTVVFAPFQEWSHLLRLSRQRLEDFGAGRNAAVATDDTLWDLLEIYAFNFRRTHRDFFRSHSRSEALAWLFDETEIEDFA